jgi:hypothetical protein
MGKGRYGMKCGTRHQLPNLPGANRVLGLDARRWAQHSAVKPCRIFEKNA